MKRIICIGNRYIPEDAAGIEVYEFLKTRNIPHDIEVIDGGLAGLNLLPLVESMERIVFVDRITGFGAEGRIVWLKSGDVATLADERFDHTSGLPFLLRVLPQVCNGTIPAIRILGIEGIPDRRTIAKASLLALKVVQEDKNWRGELP